MPDTQVMKIGLHYFFVDASHEMDAIVRHKCEGGSWGSWGRPLVLQF